ncbi:MAG: hypothetical protein HND58_15215 [Planctomycetota bacterium]|nr:MAG: hypothetical protein HND58_15215 [Planctomycetota bacterium]
MTAILTIARRELASMFRLPVGWVVVALFLVLTASVVAALDPAGRLRRACGGSSRSRRGC